MSVIGIDFGNDTCVVAIARRGGIDILANEASSRNTPTVVGFQGKERKLGEAGKTTINSNLKNTIVSMKRLLGKRYASDDVQRELKRMFCKVKDVAGTAGVPVMYNDEEVMMTPEKATGMMLKTMQQIAEKEHGSSIADCVISVPAYYTDAELHAVQDAADIVGLNVLRLMKDSTAAALAYGIYKTDLPEDKPINVMFVDVGQSDTSVSVVAFMKGKLTVLSTATDRNLGGRDFDWKIAEHFNEEWKEKYKIDAFSNPKATFRLVTACERCKKILSANPQAPINIECFMEDKDCSGMITRDILAPLVEGLNEQIIQVIQKALDESGLSKEDISTIEVVGGATRMPVVQAKVTEVFGKDVSRTLNAEECVAKGCALQGAMLSPAFRVRDFSVNDITMYPISLSWSSSGQNDAMEVDGAEEDATKASSTVVFNKSNSFPNTKMLTFYRSSTFTLSAQYDDSADLPAGFPRSIGTFIISNIPPPKTGEDGKTEPAKIKVKVRLDMHGMLTVESAQAIEEVEVEVEAPAEAPVPPLAAAPSAEDSAPAAAPAAACPAVADKVMVKKKKTQRINLTVESKVAGMNALEMKEAKEKELAMSAQDRIITETNDAMNTLESYVYQMRDKLDTTFSEFVAEADKDKLKAQLSAMEDWLYDEGMDCEKAVYVSKYQELVDACRPVEVRAREFEERKEYVDSLEALISKHLATATSGDEAYSHIDQAELDKVVKECNDAKVWMSEMKAKQAALAKTADPAFLVEDVRKKEDSLDIFCSPILNKPKPAPKVEPKKAEETKEAAAPAAAPAAADSMDVD